ncbi:MAG: hypothetical protein A2041_00765 [Bacteroidetes bacterium GWA2_31_9b]|nr:MAG: hypothetical protein A2041_00765 [Bacteroidetes bacterium GWA2_31_9b]
MKIYLSIFILLFAIINANAQEEKIVADDLLELSLEELLNIPVTVSSKKALSLRESPGIISVITEDEIQNSGARDLIDVLRLVPGIEFGTDVQGVTGISMRGNWAHEGKVLLMLDGQEQNELSFSTLLFGNHYPVDNIKKIEIIRGPGSSIYGGFAELGVINIITKGGEDINGFSVGVNYGQLSDTYGHKNINLSAGKKINDFEIALHGFYGKGNRSDKEYTDIYGNSYNMKDNTSMDPAQINLGMKYKDLHFRFIYDKYEIVTRDGFVDNFLKAYTNEFTSMFGELKYDWKISDKVTITPKLSYVSSNPWTQTEDSLPGEDPSYYNYDRTVTRIKPNLTVSYDINDKINLIGGVEYYKDNAVNNDKAWTYWNGKYEIDYTNISGFLQGIIKTNFINMTVGARLDNHSEFGTAFAPRIGFTKAFDKLHFKLLYSQAFRAPGIENIDYNSWLDTVNYQPSIKPENTQVIEGEVGYLISSGMIFTANVYYITLDNTIVYSVDEAGNEGYENKGKTGSKGFELEYILREKWGNIKLNYSYYSTKGINKIADYEVSLNDKALVGSPQNKILLNGSFKVYKGLSINPSLIYLTERYAYINYDATEDNVFIEKQDPVFFINLFINYKNLFTEGLNFGVGVYDLFDSGYQYIQPYNGWHAPIPSAGREIIAKLSYSFNMK